MSGKLNVLEHQVIEAILQCTENSILREEIYKQYEVAIVESRMFTGVGFFTEFSILDKSLKIDSNIQMRLGNVYADIKGLKHGAGFILFINNGVISTLEGYCYNEQWPENAVIDRIFKVQKDGGLIDI